MVILVAMDGITVDTISATAECTMPQEGDLQREKLCLFAPVFQEPGKWEELGISEPDPCRFGASSGTLASLAQLNGCSSMGCDRSWDPEGPYPSARKAKAASPLTHSE